MKSFFPLVSMSYQETLIDERTILNHYLPQNKRFVILFWYEKRTSWPLPLYKVVSVESKFLKLGLNLFKS